jgi:hypothetical protein
MFTLHLSDRHISRYCRAAATTNPHHHLGLNTHAGSHDCGSWGNRGITVRGCSSPEISGVFKFSFVMYYSKQPQHLSQHCPTSRVEPHSILHSPCLLLPRHAPFRLRLLALCLAHFTSRLSPRLSDRHISSSCHSTYARSSSASSFASRLSSHISPALPLASRRQHQRDHRCHFTRVGAKANALELLVRTSQARAQSQVAEATQECTSLTTLIDEWKNGVGGQREVYRKSESKNVHALLERAMNGCCVYMPSRKA